MMGLLHTPRIDLDELDLFVSEGDRLSVGSIPISKACSWLAVWCPSPFLDSFPLLQLWSTRHLRRASGCPVARGVEEGVLARCRVVALPKRGFQGIARAPHVE